MSDFVIDVVDVKEFVEEQNVEECMLCVFCNKDGNCKRTTTCEADCGEVYKVI